MAKDKIQIFENKKIRSLWDAEQEEWYFSVVDICGALSEQPNQRGATFYWGKLKQRLKEEGSELLTNCQQLKLTAEDGKMRETDCLDTKGIFRLIQSIPSPKSEPFKMWLATVGAERLDEIADPEKANLRGAEYYRAKGYTEGWINQRLQTIEMRKKLTDEWKNRGVEHEKDFAILTNEMTRAWSGMTVQEYKALKDIQKQNLRDNMTDIELTLNQLAEVTTTVISKTEAPETMEQNTEIAIRGGRVAHGARELYEKATGQKVVSPLNAKNKPALEIKNTKKSK
jgi:hypothetical protein